jgi:hypothetical protein
MASLHAWLLFRSGFWEREIAHMRKTLAQDIVDQAAAGPAASN